MLSLFIVVYDGIILFFFLPPIKNLPNVRSIGWHHKTREGHPDLNLSTSRPTFVLPIYLSTIITTTATDQQRQANELVDPTTVTDIRHYSAYCTVVVALFNWNH
ncbi:hypothetical protein Tsp_11169 [Trichinella spiralis]|uniref:hypothetical protein n=1 Tax=Trichinella spiralis TaxID=6334 RepID=UPI0001EFECAC|nr:hypothetical protein Tsp_11169 [Trichinella spiralis]